MSNTNHIIFKFTLNYIQRERNTTSISKKLTHFIWCLVLGYRTFVLLVFCFVLVGGGHHGVPTTLVVKQEYVVLSVRPSHLDLCITHFNSCVAKYYMQIISIKVYKFSFISRFVPLIQLIYILQSKPSTVEFCRRLSFLFGKKKTTCHVFL